MYPAWAKIMRSLLTFGASFPALSFHSCRFFFIISVLDFSTKLIIPHPRWSHWEAVIFSGSRDPWHWMLSQHTKCGIKFCAYCDLFCHKFRILYSIFSSLCFWLSAICCVELHYILMVILIKLSWIPFFQHFLLILTSQPYWKSHKIFIGNIFYF